MEHDETRCQAPPEGPVLCVNNCGFFGSAATMNMCSKCHQDMLMKQEQANLAATSIGNIENGSSSGKMNEAAAVAPVDIPLDVAVESMILFEQLPSGATEPGEVLKSNPKEGPNCCTTCKKRVGLTGFNCRCGNLFCGMHRYSDKHNCPFDYRMAARNAIAKANPVIKAEKLGKIERPT